MSLQGPYWHFELKGRVVLFIFRYTKKLEIKRFFSIGDFFWKVKKVESIVDYTEVVIKVEHR